MDVFICWYIWAICEFARGLQSSQGLLFSICQSFTKVHCSGNGWFTFISEFTFMLVGEGELLWDMMRRRTNFFFLGVSSTLQSLPLTITLDSLRCHDNIQSGDWSMGACIFRSLCSYSVSDWLKVFCRLETANTEWFHCGDKITFTFQLGNVLSSLSQRVFL